MEGLDFEKTLIMLGLASNEDLDEFEEMLLESKQNQEEVIEEIILNIMATEIVLERIDSIRKARGI